MKKRVFKTPAGDFIVPTNPNKPVETKVQTELHAFNTAIEARSAAFNKAIGAHQAADVADQLYEQACREVIEVAARIQHGIVDVKYPHPSGK